MLYDNMIFDCCVEEEVVGGFLVINIGSEFVRLGFGSGMIFILILWW